MGLIQKMVFIFATGLILFVVQPLINAVRVERLADVSNGVFLTFVWFMLIPIIWIIFSFLSIILLKSGIQRTESFD